MRIATVLCRAPHVDQLGASGAGELPTKTYIPAYQQAARADNLRLKSMGMRHRPNMHRIVLARSLHPHKV